MSKKPASTDTTTRSATVKAVALAFLGLLFAGFCALGVWQVQRLYWKQALMMRVESRIHAAPVAAPGPARWPMISVETDEYRRVFITGTYLQHADTAVQALTELGAGKWMLSPLQTATGIVLVNRGFVPDDARHTVTPPPTGTVRVTGLLRLDEPGGQLLRRNVPAQERWYSRDTQAIARTRQLRNVAPYFIDADADNTRQANTWPRGGMTVVKFRDQHLQYALTWFALALLCLFAAWRLLTDGRHLRHHAPDANTASRQPPRP